MRRGGEMRVANEGKGALRHRAVQDILDEVRHVFRNSLADWKRIALHPYGGAARTFTESTERTKKGSLSISLQASRAMVRGRCSAVVRRHSRSRWSASPFRVGHRAWNIGLVGRCGRSEGP